MKKTIISLIATSVFLLIPMAQGKEIEYTFDLKNPPAYAKEFFEISMRNKTAHEAGPSAGLMNESYSNLNKKLTPASNSSPEIWAAYRYAQQQCALSHLPNFKYLEALKKTAKDFEVMRDNFRPWTHQLMANTPYSTINKWALSPPSLNPRTKTEDVKKINRYITRLAAQMVRETNEIYDPNYNKHFVRNTTFDPSQGTWGRSLSDNEKEKLRITWIEEQWNDGMIRTHLALKASLRFQKATLCFLFKTHLSGDKESIREMLIEAGFKTPESRKEYWQFCRTHGAEFARWEPSDEERLVTE